MASSIDEKADKKPADKKAKASNDDGEPKATPLKKEKAKKDDAPKDYETVNESPKSKKKGWWSK